MTEMLNDRWETRDRKVLLEVARRLDAGDVSVDSRQVAEPLGLDTAECARVFVALQEDGYIAAGSPPVRGWGAGPLIVIATDLTGRGRREVGLWPSGETAADALLDALRQAEDLAEDPDDKSALRKAAGQLGTVSRSVFADITTAYIRSQTGI